MRRTCLVWLAAIGAGLLPPAGCQRDPDRAAAPRDNGPTAPAVPEALAEGRVCYPGWEKIRLGMSWEAASKAVSLGPVDPAIPRHWQARVPLEADPYYEEAYLVFDGAHPQRRLWEVFFLQPKKNPAAVKAFISQRTGLAPRPLDPGKFAYQAAAKPLWFWGNPEGYAIELRGEILVFLDYSIAPVER